MAPDPSSRPADGSNAEPIDVGVAGASARREFERRKAQRQEQTRAKYGTVIAGALELRGSPQRERAWDTGARGEERVSQRLAKECNDAVIVLHDRTARGGRANIDHIAICPTGVWVIDPKKYKGKIVVKTPLLGAAKLIIGGRDQTKLVTAMAKQVELVRVALADIAPETPIHGMLVFVDGDMPLLGLPNVQGVRLARPKGMSKLLNKTGPLTAAEVDAVARVLAERFPAAK